MGSSDRKTRLQDVGLFVVLLFLFFHFCEENYRSPQGLLRDTVPPWQREIVAGTAPAPYVYRQAVPQLRNLVEFVLSPGHAALAVDLGFGALAIACGLSLGTYAFGRAMRWSGAVLVTLALAVAYPNDKPEAVALVALTLLGTLLALAGRHGLAALVAVGCVPFRPEFAVLFGLSWIAASWASSRFRPPGTVPFHRFVVHGLTVAVGGVYLLLARSVWWPDASYPDDTAVFMLIENLRHPLRYPGLVLVLLLGSIGAKWCSQAIGNGGRARSFLPPLEREARIGVGLFVILWCVAHMVLGKTDEVRLSMPIFPLCLALASRRWPLWGVGPSETGSAGEVRERADDLGRERRG